MIVSKDEVLIEAGIQEDMDNQFEEMDYTISCGTCGEEIATLLLRDLGGDGITSRVATQGLYATVHEHNLTHYVPPKIIACEDDDVFGVDHSKCAH